MFRSLCKNVLSQLSKQQHPPNKINTTFLSPQLYCQIGCIATTKSHDISSQDTSLTISYLQSSCGLSPQSALSASKFIRLKSTEKPDHVLQLLKDYGFSDTQITTAISRWPKLLVADPEMTLKPKLEYLRRVTGSQLADILSVNPTLLVRSIERTIAASVDYLNSMDPSGSVLRMVLKTHFNLSCIMRNVKCLKDNGAAEDVIVKMLKVYPRPMSLSSVKFSAAIEMAKGVGLDPKSLMFAHVLGVVSYFSTSTFDRRMEFYRRLGWSDRDTLSVLCRQPSFLRLSEKVAMEKIRFFKEVAGWDMSDLSARPLVLTLSIDKRIAPRYAVLNILMLRGLVKKNTKPTKQLSARGSKFYDDFVDKYKEQAPEVVNAFRGELEFKGWGWIDKQAVEDCY